MPETFLDESTSGSAWAAEASGAARFGPTIGTNAERCETLSDICAERWLRPFLPRV